MGRGNEIRRIASSRLDDGIGRYLGMEYLHLRPMASGPGLRCDGGPIPASGGTPMIRLNVNGKPRDLDIPGDTPLLWTLRDVLSMTGTKFGCGAALCGACTVHIDGQPTRSCVTPISAVVGKRIITIEAIGATPAGKNVQSACTFLPAGVALMASMVFIRSPTTAETGVTQDRVGCP